MRTYVGLSGLAERGILPDLPESRAIAWAMRWLVTGGSGFLGINFVRHLLTRGEDVTSLDREAD